MFWCVFHLEFVFFRGRLGTHIIVLTQTEVDKTGKSYYGESNLYYMATAGNYDCRVVLGMSLSLGLFLLVYVGVDKEGPIHDLAWSPNSKEFIVIYGCRDFFTLFRLIWYLLVMPAKATLFDHRANKVHDFGQFPRNFVRFNPHGRVICIAGFGNLAGQVDFWDRKTLKQIAQVDASGSAACEWSPCGRYIMTATLSPRLRVDNGYKIWHYTGTLVHQREISELYQVCLFSKRSG